MNGFWPYLPSADQADAAAAHDRARVRRPASGNEIRRAAVFPDPATPRTSSVLPAFDLERDIAKRRPTRRA